MLSLVCSTLDSVETNHLIGLLSTFTVLKLSTWQYWGKPQHWVPGNTWTWNMKQSLQINHTTKNKGANKHTIIFNSRFLQWWSLLQRSIWFKQQNIIIVTTPTQRCSNKRRTMTTFSSGDSATLPGSLIGLYCFWEQDSGIIKARTSELEPQKRTNTKGKIEQIARQSLRSHGRGNYRRVGCWRLQGLEAHCMRCCCPNGGGGWSHVRHLRPAAVHRGPLLPRSSGSAPPCWGLRRLVAFSAAAWWVVQYVPFTLAICFAESP